MSRVRTVPRWKIATSSHGRTNVSKRSRIRRPVIFGNGDFTPVETARSRIFPTGWRATSRTVSPRNSETKNPSWAGTAVVRAEVEDTGVATGGIVGSIRGRVNEFG